MDIEEVRKRKDEAEAEIKDIICRYIEDTDTNVTKIIVSRQCVSGHIEDKIIRVTMEVIL